MGNPARVVKLVDTSDLKSAASLIGAYRFDSGPGHHNTCRFSGAHAIAPAVLMVIWGANWLR